MRTRRRSSPSKKVWFSVTFDDNKADTTTVVLTGEEDEETIHQVRGKLYVLCPQNQWKERGTGQLRLNVRRFDGGGARLGELLG